MPNDPLQRPHSHDFLGDRHDQNARRTIWVVLLTAVMMVVEIACGLITGSMALLADGIHMATHAGALGIAAFAYSYAKKHADNPRYGWGTGKVGELAGFASALVLGIFSLGIAYESVSRLLAPGDVAFAEATVVAVIGLLVNIASAFMLGHGHDHSHDHAHGHADHGRGVQTHHAHGGDNNLRAAYVHVLADALTSIMAIVALLAGRYLGWVWLDPVMGLVGALVIARWAWSLMKDTSAVLLDATDVALEDKVRSVIDEYSQAAILDLHVWQVGPGAHAAVIELDGECPLPQLRQRISAIPKISHLTIVAH